MVHATYDQFLDLHRSQLQFSGIPEHYWPSIFQKILKQTFDAQNIFSLMEIAYEDEERGPKDPVWLLQIKAEAGVDCTDPQHVYLVDHAWTFQVEYARKQLIANDGLRSRMATIMGFDGDDEKISLSEKIFGELWRYASFYSIGNAEKVEDRLPIWFVMDEVGCGIQHSDAPNFRMVPFINVSDQVAYSLIYPVKNLNFGDVVYRDFTEGYVDSTQKSALSLPWKEVRFAGKSFDFLQQGAEYFLGGHIRESLPILENFHNLEKPGKFKVFSEYRLIEEFLTDDRFEIVDSEDESDIIWLTRHFKNFEDLSKSPGKFVNQFPFEYILTIKDLLCITCRRKNVKNFDGLTSNPKWLPATYNLKTETPEFVSYYQNRSENNLDNHWIVKPFNLARSLDTHITDNLNFILRLAATGPKIAQKYIENPVLFHREEIPGKVKFDVRYVVLLKSTKPLQVYAYKNFFLRFANQPYSLSDFDEYEKHFTVMNYTEKAVLKRMLCAEFKETWGKQYDISWDVIEKSIYDMLKQVFECAVIEGAPCGIAESPQSRALYAADIMLEWDNAGGIQPKILEMNWTPDCKRACEYYNDFYNDIFKLLFLDEVNDSTIQEL